MCWSNRIRATLLSAIGFVAAASIGSACGGSEPGPLDAAVMSDADAPDAAPDAASDAREDAERPAVTDIVCGYRHACVRRSDGSVRCWGRFVGGGAPPEKRGPFTKVTAGYYTCGLGANGALSCWGDEGDVRVPTGSFVAISQLFVRSCGLRSDGSAVCFDIDQPDVVEAAPVPLRAVSAGMNGPCGLRASDGHPLCWKPNSPSSPPAEELSALSVGGTFACGLRLDGTLTCWGKGNAGELAAPSGTFVDTKANAVSACARRSDGTLACWGSFGEGKEPVPAAGAFVDFCVGDTFGCGLRPDRTVACWGLDTQGQSSPPAEL